MGKGYNNWEKIKTDPDLENIRNSRYYLETIKNHKEADQLPVKEINAI